jgi:hypothetical protein
MAQLASHAKCAHITFGLSVFSLSSHFARRLFDSLNCQEKNPAIYHLCFALLIVQYVIMMLPCLFLMCLAPMVSWTLLCSARRHRCTQDPRVKLGCLLPPSPSHTPISPHIMCVVFLIGVLLPSVVDPPVVVPSPRCRIARARSTRCLRKLDIEAASAQTIRARFVRRWWRWRR